MELNEFISNTIKQITDGILEGDKYVKEKGKSQEGVRSQYTKVNFDIAVGTNEEEKDELGGKISVVQLFNVSGSSASTTKNTNYNRIQFEILISVNTGGYKNSVL